MQLTHLKIVAAIIPVFISAGCTSGVLLPTYPYVGIELGAAFDGTLVRAENCIRVESPIQVFVPIWPRGTAVEPTGIRLPAANGGQLLRFGRNVRMRGGYNPGKDRFTRNYEQVARCGGAAFLLNSASEL